MNMLAADHKTKNNVGPRLKKIRRGSLVVISQRRWLEKHTSTLSPSLTVVSLFSGCGGLDLGFIGNFEFLGKYYGKTLFDIVWANELNSAACRTYRKNIGSHIVEGDVWDALPNIPTSADVVIGGFPARIFPLMAKVRALMANEVAFTAPWWRLCPVSAQKCS